MQFQDLSKPSSNIIEQTQFFFYSLFYRRSRWLFVLFIVGVYLAAFLFGVLSSKFNPKYVVVLSVAPLLFLGGLLLLKRLDYGPLVILLSALFVPFDLPTGTGSRLVISLLVSVVILVLWFLNAMTVEKRFVLQKAPVNFPIIGFTLVTLISIIWSNIFRDPFVAVWSTFLIVQIASGVVMVMLPITYLLVGNLVKDLRHLKWLIIIMLAAGFLGLVKFFTRVNLPVDTRGMFALWIFSLAYGLLLFKKDLHWFWRVALVILIAGWIYWNFIVGISWIAGWFPGFIAMGILTLLRSRKLAFLALLVAALVFALNSDYYLGEVLKTEDEQSGRTRLAAWQTNWSITKDHLLLGTGPAGYAAYYMSYFPTNAMATHSNYIDLVSQVGVVGFLLAVSFFIIQAKESYKLCRRFKGRGDFVEALTNSVFAGTIACIVIMAFGDWLFPFAYTQTIAGFNYAVYNWIFMGTVLVLDRYTANS